MTNSLQLQQVVGYQWQQALQDCIVENEHLFEYIHDEAEYEIELFDVFRDFVTHCEQLLEEYGKRKY